jgi:hypothetical protein
MVQLASSEPAVLSVSCAGGMARQYRVQVRDDGMNNSWRHIAVFRRADEAHRLAEQLRLTGKFARIIDCRSLPTAA